MRTRVLRGLVATLLALAVALPGTTTPAHAVSDSSESIVKVVFSVYRLLTGGLQSSDVEQLILEAIGAVDQAEEEVITHLDALQAAEVKAAARSASIQFADYDEFRHNIIVLWSYMSDVSGSAALAYESVRTVTDPRAADQIGHAVNVLYPIGMLAAEDAGMPGTRAGLMEDYQETNEYILEELEPDCTSREVQGTPAHIVEIHITCTAANGDEAVGIQVRNHATGQWLEGPVDVGALKEVAAADSSWLVAKRVLEADTP